MSGVRLAPTQADVRRVGKGNRERTRYLGNRTLHQYGFDLFHVKILREPIRLARRHPTVTCGLLATLGSSYPRS